MKKEVKAYEREVFGRVENGARSAGRIGRRVGR